MRRKRTVLITFGVVAISAVFAATAFACTIFRGTLTVVGNGSSTAITSTGLRTGMSQRLTPGIAKVTATGGSIKVSTGKDQYSVGLPAGSYQINYLNGPVYSNHTNTTFAQDCMGNGNGVNLGIATVGTNGQLAKQPLSFKLPTSTRNTAPQESAVCVSNSTGTFGNQAPLTVM